MTYLPCHRSHRSWGRGSEASTVWEGHILGMWGLTLMRDWRSRTVIAWILLYLVTFDFKTLKPFGIFGKYSPTAQLTYNVVTYHPNNSIPDVIPFTIAARVLRTVDLTGYSQLTNLERCRIPILRHRISKKRTLSKSNLTPLIPRPKYIKGAKNLRP